MCQIRYYYVGDEMMGCLKSKRGFSLVELAMVMVVSGIIMSAVADVYRVYAERKSVELTSNHLATIQESIQAFYNKNGRYPCPARANLNYDNSIAAGDENCSAGVVSGITRVVGRGGNTVLIGAIPYSTLRKEDTGATATMSLYTLPQNTALDGWGQKMTYAVTELQTKKTTFKQESGAVYIRTEGGAPADSLVEPDGSVHFMLVSHGRDRKGSYARSGTITAACASSPGNDNENCDNDAEFIQGIIIDPVGALHYDDYVLFHKVSQGSLWSRVKTAAGVITIDVYNLNSGNIGVGFTAPTAPTTPTERLHVVGDVKADNVFSRFICDQTGTRCFQASTFGSATGDRCTGSATTIGLMTGIELGRVRCTTAAAPAVYPVFTCPVGQVLTGISYGGNYTCKPRP